jgi:hypothetical protein
MNELSRKYKSKYGINGFNTKHGEKYRTLERLNR